jgi:pimeloyl-ACP methyl ester carboxylesterase
MPGQAFTAATPDGPICGTVDGSGQALLLVHGGPAVTDYLELLGSEVDGWRAVRYQQRSVPPSATKGPFTIEQHVADAVAVLDTLQIGRAVVLGHSWGGHLTLQLALAHPGRVAGLVIVDGLGAVGDGGLAEFSQHLSERRTPEIAARLAEVEARLDGREPSDDDALESLRLDWPGYFADPATAPQPPDNLRVSVAGYAGTMASVAEHLAAGFADALRDLRVPAVFLLGGKSPMPLSQGQQTAALLPVAEVTVAPGGGHQPWHEEPGCVAAALARIRELASSPDPA